MNEFRLSKNEMEIMSLFWQEGRPLSKSEIIELSADRSWKASSVYVLLNSLLKKGAIREAGFVKSQTNIGRTFEAMLNENEYVIMQINNDIKERNLSLVDLMAGLINQETDKSVVEKLDKVIKNKLKTEK